MRQAISNAGIAQKEDGGQEIPASKRKDGSTRAPIRIRPGFVPTEDVAKYRPPRSRVVAPLAESTESVPRIRPTVMIKENPAVLTAGETLKTAARTTEKQTVRPLKTSWAEAGWRGSTDSPSRWARKPEIRPVQVRSASQNGAKPTTDMGEPSTDVVSCDSASLGTEPQQTSKKATNKKTDASTKQLEELGKELGKIDITSK